MILLTFIALLWLVLSLVPVTLGRASPQARATACKSNLEQIARALGNYLSVKANLGLPPDLDTLCHGFIEDHRVLRCPDRWQEDNGAIGYVWIPNRRKTEKDELARILAYDKFPHPLDPPTRNVLFTDLTVGTLTEEELQKRLREERE